MATGIFAHPVSPSHGHPEGAAGRVDLTLTVPGWFTVHATVWMDQDANVIDGQGIGDWPSDAPDPLALAAVAAERYLKGFGPFTATAHPGDWYTVAFFLRPRRTGVDGTIWDAPT